jgi:hypothetical protein
MFYGIVAKFLATFFMSNYHVNFIQLTASLRSSDVLNCNYQVGLVHLLFFRKETMLGNLMELPCCLEVDTIFLKQR